MNAFAGVASHAVSPTCVAVRDPSGEDPELGRLVLGTRTHEGRLFGALWSVTVQFDSGVARQVPPDWVTPALDLAALFNLPRAGRPGS